MFTVTMVSTHIVFISTNQTTVEHLAARTVKDREDVTLDEMHTFCAFGSVSFFLSPRPTPAPFFVCLPFLCKLSSIGRLFQGKAAYTTNVGCRVRAYRARG
jgi:hypothetical protein